MLTIIAVAYVGSLVAAAAIGTPLMMRRQRKIDSKNVALYIK